jgi:TonB-dependent starch-binding outer membrane protein SusC
MKLQKTKKPFLTRLMMVLTLLSTFGFSSIAQVAITGKVTNQKDNSALEGISIVIKGTKKGTNTDNNGNFSLTLPIVLSLLLHQVLDLKVKIFL